MKKCIVLHIDKKEIKRAAKEAADELGLYHSNIVACCNGRRATCGGLEWEYL